MVLLRACLAVLLASYAAAAAKTAVCGDGGCEAGRVNLAVCGDGGCEAGNGLTLHITCNGGGAQGKDREGKDVELSQVRHAMRSRNTLGSIDF